MNSKRPPRGEHLTVRPGRVWPSCDVGHMSCGIVHHHRVDTTKVPRRGRNRPGHGNGGSTPMQLELIAAVPYGYCHCGCGEKTPISTKTNEDRGYVKGAPRRYVPGHHYWVGPDYLVDSDTGCWIWQRYLHPDGYGWTNRGERPQPAHRWMYERTYGKVAFGVDIHHRCENRRCVNPTHLKAIDHREHARLHVRERGVNGRFLPTRRAA